jgi:single-stranded-DNA-specific exonuclease
MNSATLIARRANPRAQAMLEQAGLHPLLARLFAARGAQSADDVSGKLQDLLPPTALLNVQAAATLLADAIQKQERLCIVADYDCDGATACAVAMRGLTMLGAAPGSVDYLVPNRFETGYGLSPDVVKLAANHPRLGKPDWLITVDNGIASVEGVAEANAAGMRVLVTDHHLPGSTLPAAACIVNPNQPGCSFASKDLAGVGVMFYVLLVLRHALRERGAFTEANQPRLDGLLDLVALGTVADVVRLDANNRILVAQGLQRMRMGRVQPGIAALFAIAGRDARRATTFDLGFALGPRINAAGRLADMSLGIACLLTDDFTQATQIAQQLDAINRERRDVQAAMQGDALDAIADQSLAARAGIVLHQAHWHQGVVGVVAGRVKELFWRPTIAFAPADDTQVTLRGSGRSIPGLHLRDALDLVSKRAPGVIQKFGGHAMAAGLSIAAQDLAIFSASFEAVCDELLPLSARKRLLETDGAIAPQDMTTPLVELLNAQVWGQGFAAPLFEDTFTVLNQRLVKDAHLKLTLEKAGTQLNAIWFNHTEPLPSQARLAYRLAADNYQGRDAVQLMIEHYEISLSSL